MTEIGALVGRCGDRNGVHVVMSGCDRCGCAWASLVRGINGWHLLCVPCFDEVYRLTREERRP
jgi:hypothetical protein